MILDSRTIAWILRIASGAFWLLISVRMAASWATSASPDRSGEAREPIAAPGTLTIFWITCLSMVGNSTLLALWSKKPALAGPTLLSGSAALQWIGLGLMASGLGLMAWAYLVFRSFRLLQERGNPIWSAHPFNPSGCHFRLDPGGCNK